MNYLFTDYTGIFQIKIKVTCVVYWLKYQDALACILVDQWLLRSKYRVESILTAAVRFKQSKLNR